MCWYKEDSWTFFFVKSDVLFWKRSSFVCLEESVRVPSVVPSSLRHRCRSWRLIFLKSVSRLPDYPTLKIDSHETWKCSVTRKKYFERPHTQRCSDGSGWEQHPVPKFLNRTIVLAPNVVVFFFDHYANTLFNRVVQRSQTLRSYQPTSCAWLSRLSFFGMDYTVILQIFGVVLCSVISVVDGFTEIKTTPKWEKYIDRSRQQPQTPKFKRTRTLCNRSLPKF